ncbi:aminotransferase family protein-like protein [Acephala macrosclerotiorum]|nr:aminotransferase family protein-like protein [Acephala macrosclerotiorum]
MGELIESKMGEVSLDNAPEYESTPFGKEMLKHFLIDPAYRNLNHGSFGTFPRVIRDKQREYQALCESGPDAFMRYDYFKFLQENRAAAAKAVNAPTEAVVFVSNATTGVNTVLRNILWNYHGKDEIIYFRHIYGACLKTVEYVCEANHNIVNPREIVVHYPMEDEDLLWLFRQTIQASRAEGKNPRIAIFDTVSSLPGLRMPFEGLTKICKEEGVLSLIDGAHGIGHVHIDMATLDPDFFVSNVHKWLYVPRGCAVFYVPVKNQHMIRSSLPTSHGFIPNRPTNARNPLPPTSANDFQNSFEFVGTIDCTNYLVVKDSIKWREQVCGGEKAIIDYTSKLAKEGGKAVAKILGTKILDNSSETLTDCSLVNVLLPLKVSESMIEGVNTVKDENAMAAAAWMQHTLITVQKIGITVYFFQGQFWTRLSGQIYLDLNDFEETAHALKKMCERAGNGEFLEVGKN